MMTPEELGKFLARRAGKLTASSMSIAMDFRKDGKPGAARSQLLRDLLAERIADCNRHHYVSAAMEHGIAFEDEAKMAYEAATGNLIADPRQFADMGVFDHPRIENFAASPDGILDRRGRRGGLEVKCPTPGKYIDWILAGVVPEEHKPQMIAQAACASLAFVDFVAYEPRMRDHSRRIFIREFVPTPDDIIKVVTAAEAFLADLEQLFDAFITVPA